MVLPISARQLHQMTLIDKGRSYQGVTLFPFFDRDGMVHQVMVIIPPGEVYYLAADSGRLRVDWLGRARLNAHVSDLPRMRQERTKGMERLWHFDPWWLLKEPQFANLSWVPAVKASNCGELFGGALFDRRLKRLTAVQSLKDINEISYFNAHMMPPERQPLRHGASVGSGGGFRWRKGWSGWVAG